MTRGLEDLLDRFYGRFGSAGLVFLCAAGSFISASLNALMMIIFGAGGYLQASLDETLKLVLLAEIGLSIGMILVAASLHGMIRTALSWQGSDRTDSRAADVWRAVVSAPRTLVTRAGVALLAVELPGVALAMWFLDEPAHTFPPAYVLFAAGTAANCVFVMFGMEILLRPLMRDVAKHLPPGFEPTVPALRLRTKVLAPIPGATLFAGLFVGAFADTSAGHALRLTSALAIALGLAALSVAMFLISTRSTLDPIDRLTDATRRIKDGELTSVPVVTADELGTLAHSFNQMVEGLRERESLREELQLSRARIVATADEERRRMERDLHDGAQQHLVLLKMKLGLLEAKLDAMPEARNDVEGLKADLATALAELRDLAHGIYPAILEHEGLPAALRDAVERSPVYATLESNGTSRYRPELEAAVYFCCLEALQNAAKHAPDSKVKVSLSEREETLAFEVADDGPGFDPASHNGSTGLQNMADRIGALGGELQVRSSPGEGTTIRGRVGARVIDE
jgi:signal transduction histidine kinase